MTTFGDSPNMLLHACIGQPIGNIESGYPGLFTTFKPHVQW